MAPHQHLSKRAQITINGAGGIVLLVLLIVGALFCIVTVVLICKRKRTRKQNQRKLAGAQESQPFVAQESQPFVAQESQPFVAQESQPFVAQEPRPYVVQEYRMPGNRVEMESQGVVELQGGVVDDPSTRKPQQLDGFVAPAATAYDGRPVEMAAQSSSR
jgi:hypothetical protein